MKNHKTPIFICGASGHAKIVIDIIENEGRYKIVALLDDDRTKKNLEFYGYHIIGGRLEEDIHGKIPPHGIVAIGDNSIRNSVAQWISSHGLELVTTIHPSAQIGRGSAIGTGCVVMPNAVINSDSSLGNNVIVNTGASIDHDCSIAHAVHIGPGATLCASVHIGEKTFVGAGATIIPGVQVGKNVTIGAGATVVQNIPDGLKVVGTPARAIKGSS